jgi:hypothetical protein
MRRKQTSKGEGEHHIRAFGFLRGQEVWLEGGWFFMGQGASLNQSHLLLASRALAQHMKLGIILFLFSQEKGRE